jgi:hypothetical protein
MAGAGRGWLVIAALIVAVLGLELRQLTSLEHHAFFQTAMGHHTGAGGGRGSSASGSGSGTQGTAPPQGTGGSAAPGTSTIRTGDVGGPPSGGGTTGSSGSGSGSGSGTGTGSGAGSGGGSGSGTGTGDGLLDWAPPVLHNPVTIDLPATGTVRLDLDNSRDYIIRYPDVRRVGGLTLRGGRDIVIIGGASTLPPHAGKGLRNIQIKDKPGVMDGRIIHIEGLDIDGSGGGEGDGIGIGAPSAIVQLENDRITGLIGHFSSTHADVIQTWGGVKQLRIDQLTGASHYNNLYLRRENSPLEPGDRSVVLNNVNLFGYVNPPGWDEHTTLRAIAIGTQPPNSSCDGHRCGPPNPDDPVNCQVPGPIVLDNVYAEPPGGPLNEFAWPTATMSAAGCAAVLSPDGTTMSWPALSAAVGGPVTGDIQLGRPPRGDFVPAGSVGVGYVSPGYR